MVYLDLMTYHPDDILQKVDRASMAVSLETRVPFLDHDFVEFVMALPLKFKVSKGKGKHLLKKFITLPEPQPKSKNILKSLLFSFAHSFA